MNDKIFFEDNNEIFYKKIFTEYYYYVYQMAYFKTHDSFLAEDITQDIFMSIWLKPPIIQNIPSFKGYLRQLVHNKVVDHIRKTVSKNNFINLKLKEIDDSIITNEITNKELNFLLRRSISMLSPKAQTIFSLYYEYGIPQKEIAQIIGINVQSVKNSLQRTIPFLRNKLKFYKNKI